MSRPTKQLEDMTFDGWDQLDAHLEFVRASRCGRIKNIKTGKILKPWIKPKGHLAVSISKNGVVKKYLVHRIIARCFIKNKDPLRNIINHKDGDPANNKVENLEWCTDKENRDHAKKNRLYQQSCKRYNAKFDDCKILTIHTIKKPHTEIAKHYGVSQSVITRIKNFNTYSNFAVIYDK